MATRTVRLDEEAEAALHEVREATGLPISEALKRGLRSLQAEVRHELKRTPHDIYRTIDLGAGGDAIVPSSETRRGVVKALKKALPMILADTAFGTRKIFTIDRRDFATYRVRRGHRHYPVDMLS